MALRRPNLPSFGDAADQLSLVDVCSSSSNPVFVTANLENTAGESQQFISPNGHKSVLSLDSEGCSNSSDSFVSTGQLDQEMTALTVHERIAASPKSSSSSVELYHSVAISDGSDCKSAEMRCNFTKPPADQLLRSPNNQGHKASRSPVHGSGNRPYSLVEERAKRYSQKSTGSETRTVNNGAMTLPASTRPVAYSSGYNAKTIHGSTAASQRVLAQPVKPVISPRSVNDHSDMSPEETMWLRKTACQAPPPAEVLSLPLVPVSTVDVLPGILDEQIMLFEQSLRVEPSPERILAPAPVASVEEEIRSVNVNTGK